MVLNPIAEQVAGLDGFGAVKFSLELSGVWRSTQPQRQLSRCDVKNLPTERRSILLGLTIVGVLLSGLLSTDGAEKQKNDDDAPILVSDLTEDQFAQYVRDQMSRAAESQRKISKALDPFFTGRDDILGQTRENLDAPELKLIDGLAAQQLQTADEVRKLIDLLSASLVTRKIDIHKQLLAELKESEIAKSLTNSSKRIKENRLFGPRVRSAKLAKWFDQQLLRLQSKEQLERKKSAQQDGPDQPATAPESKPVAKESLTLKLSDKFGEVFNVTIEFVEKPKTYYAQNIVKAKWFAKVKAVNGKALEEPMVMEYRSHEENFKKGSTVTLRAYEDIESSGVNREWDGVVRQSNYGISHFIHVRIPKEKDDTGQPAPLEELKSDGKEKLKSGSKGRSK